MRIAWWTKSSPTDVHRSERARREDVAGIGTFVRTHSCVRLRTDVRATLRDVRRRSYWERRSARCACDTPIGTNARSIVDTVAGNRLHEELSGSAPPQ